MNNTPSTRDRSTTPGQLRMDRIVYGTFTIAGIIFILVRDWNNAMIFMGLAPICDPFAPLPFKERPTWQQAWLYVHLTLTMVVLAMTIRAILR